MLPGFHLTLGYAIVYLSLLILIPLSAVFIKTFEMSFADFWSTVTDPRIVATYRVSFGISLLAAGINAVFGLLLAWILVRYTFPGRKIVDALVDLPFALPTAVAGIALTALYAPNGWIGQFFHAAGIKVAYSAFGVTLALVFIGLPFVVRTVQPVLADIPREVEEAAACRDQVRVLQSVLHKQFVDSRKDEDVDVLAAIEADGLTCVNIAMVRGGRHLGGCKKAVLRVESFQSRTGRVWRAAGLLHHWSGGLFFQYLQPAFS